jgi:hypothetical protein
MLPVHEVNAILAPHRLVLIDGGTRVKSMDFEFGTVGIEAVYEMMFLHDVSREQALKDIAMLLNVASPAKKYDPPKKAKLKKVTNA